MLRTRFPSSSQQRTKKEVVSNANILNPLCGGLHVVWPLHRILIGGEQQQREMKGDESDRYQSVHTLLSMRIFRHSMGNGRERKAMGCSSFSRGSCVLVIVKGTIICMNLCNTITIFHFAIHLRLNSDDFILKFHKEAGNG